MAVMDRPRHAPYPFLALVRRELLSHLRTRRLFFGLLTLSVACAWVVLGQWPFGEQFDWRTLVYRSESLFTTFSMLALTGGPILVAAIAGGALVGERERESWDLLQLSLISRLGIVAGKLLSPLAMFGLTLAVCTPIFAALLFLAGLDFVRAAESLLLIVVTSITCGAIALACSVRARRTVTAMTITFFFVALFMGLDAVAIVALAELVELPVSLDASAVFVLSPYFVLGSLLQSGEPMWQLLSIHLGFQVIVTVPALGYCVWALGWGDVPVSDEGRPVRPWIRRRGTRYEPSRRRRGPIPDGSNPVFRREVYWGSPLTGRRARRFGVALFVGAFLISAALAYTGSSTTSWDGRLLMMIIATTITGGVACLYVPIVCSSAYTKEFAIANFDMLRGTLLRPHDIVWGKFKAALVLCGAVWAVCFLANLPMNLWYLSDSRGWYMLLLSYGSLYAALVEGAAAALLVSFYSKRSGAAMVASYLAVFMIYFGFFIIVAIAAQGLNLSDRSLPVRALIVTSPVLTYFWRLIEIVDRDHLDRLIDWFASLGVVGVFALSSQLWMVRRFDARVGKLADG